MELLSCCANIHGKKSLKKAIKLRQREASEEQLVDPSGELKKPFDLPLFYTALRDHHPTNKQQLKLLYFNKGDSIKVLEKGEMWRGIRQQTSTQSSDTDKTTAPVSSVKREDGALKTPEPLLASSNAKSTSAWFPPAFVSSPVDAFQRALIQPDLLQSTDDISSVIDLPPAMSDFDHLRYCKTPNVEVIKRPQNTLSKDSDRDSGISPQQYQQYYGSQCQNQSNERTAEWLGRYMTNDAISNNHRRNSAGSSNGSSGMMPSSPHNGPHRTTAPAQCHPPHCYPPASPSSRYQHRLSAQSTESGVSLNRNSYGSNSSLTGGNVTSSSGTASSLVVVDEKPSIDVASLTRAGVSDNEIIKIWLQNLNLHNEYYDKFINSCYDMSTISRMTPEDLTAIGIANPAHRKLLKSEIGMLKIYDGIPDFKPTDVSHWLSLLHLERYLETLQSQGYRSLDDVTEITWEDMEEIGIKPLGHQKKLVLAISKLIRINEGHKRLSSLSSLSKNSEIEPPSFVTPAKPISRTPTKPTIPMIPGSPMIPRSPMTSPITSNMHILKRELSISSFRPTKNSSHSQDANMYCTLPRKRCNPITIEERPPSADERLLVAAANAISSSFTATPPQRIRKKPPPPPKRTASIKKPEHRDIVKLSEDLPPSKPAHPLRVNTTANSETLSNVVQRLNEANNEDSFINQQKSKRKSSTTSLDSQFDNNSLHFANENVGTIKQKNAAAKISIIPQPTNPVDNLFNSTLTENTSSEFNKNENIAPELPKRQDSIGVTNRIDSWSTLRNPKQAPKPSCPIIPIRSPIYHHSNTTTTTTLDNVSSSNTESLDDDNPPDVLGDIDSMLQNLTNELDALLEGEINST